MFIEKLEPRPQFIHLIGMLMQFPNHVVEPNLVVALVPFLQGVKHFQ